jgi:hypothetical protein
MAAATPAAIRERTSVFAAYLLPGIRAESLADGVTPVNAVRLILRHYFSADMPALPDLTFWSASDRPYLFEPVPASASMQASTH